MAQKQVIFEHAGKSRQVSVPDDATDAEIADLYNSEYPEVAGPPPPVTPTPKTAPITKESSLYEKAFTPPESVTKFAKSISDYLTTPRTRPVELSGEAIAAGGTLHPSLARTETSADPLAATTGGMIEGIASQLSPGNVALTALGAGEVAAGRRGMQGIERIAGLGTKLGGAGVAYHGGTTLLSPESTLQERLGAIPELAGGALGMRSRGRVPEIAKAAPEMRPEIITPPTEAIPRDILAEQSIRHEFTPVGEEPPVAPKEAPKTKEQISYELARNKFDMGREMPAEEMTKQGTEVFPTTLVVKKDVPETVKKLLSYGYKMVGVDEQGRPRMVLEEAEASRAIPEELKQEWVPETAPSVAAAEMAPPVKKKVHVPEVLPAESELDIFGIPKDRDITSEEAEVIKQGFRKQIMDSYGEDTVEGQAALDELEGLFDVKPVVKELPAAAPEKPKSKLQQTREAQDIKSKSMRALRGFVTSEEGSKLLPESLQQKEEATPKRIFVKDDSKEVRKALLTMGYEATGASNKQGHPIWAKQAEGEQAGIARELYNLPRGMMSVDPPFMTSAAFRQGLPMTGVNPIGWAKAWVDQARAYGSEQAYQGIMSNISKDPLFRKTTIPTEKMNAKTGEKTITEKEGPSVAEQLGLDMTDLGSFTRREEVLKSKWAEKLPIWGRHVRASNRAYTAFLNSLRANSLRKFVDQAAVDNRSLSGRNIPATDLTTDLVKGRQVAQAINVLTGRGKLKLDLPFTEKTLDAERAAKILSDVFFSPRLMASRVKMLNPATYVNADPFVRKMYVKGLLGAIGTWWTLASLAEMAGAEVSKDPNSADFGKIKIGNTRIDPGGGFQQHLVLASRLRPEWFASPVDIPFPPYGEMVEDPGGGKFTSTTSGRTSYLGEGFKPETRMSLLENFLKNKIHPTPRLAIDILSANEDQPVYLADRLLQMAVPMMTGDLAEIMQESPALLPLVFSASGTGMGSQTYEGGKQEPSITPMLGLEDFDYQFGGQ